MNILIYESYDLDVLTVVWGEKLLVSLVRGTGHTTREHIRGLVRVIRLVNTLDNLYQSIVLDILEYLGPMQTKLKRIWGGILFPCIFEQIHQFSATDPSNRSCTENKKKSEIEN